MGPKMNKFNTEKWLQWFRGSVFMWGKVLMTWKKPTADESMTSCANQMRSSDVLPWGRLPCPAPNPSVETTDWLKGLQFSRLENISNYVAMVPSSLVRAMHSQVSCLDGSSTPQTYELPFAAYGVHLLYSFMENQQFCIVLCSNINKY